MCADLDGYRVSGPPGKSQVLLVSIQISVVRVFFLAVKPGTHLAKFLDPRMLCLNTMVYRTFFVSFQLLLSF